MSGGGGQFRIRHDSPAEARRGRPAVPILQWAVLAACVAFLAPSALHIHSEMRCCFVSQFKGLRVVRTRSNGGSVTFSFSFFVSQQLLKAWLSIG